MSSVSLAECVAQPTPFRQRFWLMRFVCGESTHDAALTSRLLEHTGPLDAEEARIIAEGWNRAAAGADR